MKDNVGGSQGADINVPEFVDNVEGLSTEMELEHYAHIFI